MNAEIARCTSQPTATALLPTSIAAIPIMPIICIRMPNITPPTRPPAQTDIDAWPATGHKSRRYRVRGFLAWPRQRGTAGELTLVVLPRRAWARATSGTDGFLSSTITLSDILLLEVPEVGS
jgi:hypothetical protein